MPPSDEPASKPAESVGARRPPADPTAAEAGAELPFRLGYRPELDGLRALAVALVFMSHIGYPWQSLMGNFMPGAFQGVDLFFVLSGFLLTTLLIEERADTGRFSFVGFYRRRALRLFPALFFMLIVLVPWIFNQYDDVGVHFQAYIYMALYVTNWAVVFGHDGIVPFNFSHMWSLAIEEQYYLLFFPLFVGLLGWFKKLSSIAWVLVGMIVLVWINRYVAALNTSPGDFETTLYVRTDTRADALLLGPLLAVWLQMGHRITPRLRLLAIPAVAFLVWTILYARVNDPWVYYWGLGVMDICWLIVLASVLGARHVFARVLRVRPVVWMGTISYGLYLWHMPVFVEMMRHTRYRRLPHWLPFSLAVLTTFAVASFSYYLVERRFLRRKRPGLPDPAPPDGGTDPPRDPAVAQVPV